MFPITEIETIKIPPGAIIEKLFDDDVFKPLDLVRNTAYLSDSDYVCYTETKRMNWSYAEVAMPYWIGRKIGEYRKKFPDIEVFRIRK